MGLLDYLNTRQRNTLADSARRGQGLLDLQAMRDSALPGSVGAPGGLLADTSDPYRGGQLGNALALSSLAPGIGDFTGPMADAHMFYTQPESRTIPNYLMAATGMLPAIPSLAYLMSRGSQEARHGGNQSGIIGYYDAPNWSRRTEAIPVGIDPDMDEIEDLFWMAEEQAPALRDPDILRKFVHDGKTYMWPAELGLHQDVAESIGLPGLIRENGITRMSPEHFDPERHGIITYEDVFGRPMKKKQSNH